MKFSAWFIDQNLRYLSNFAPNPWTGIVSFCLSICLCVNVLTQNRSDLLETRQMKLRTWSLHQNFTFVSTFESNPSSRSGTFTWWLSWLFRLNYDTRQSRSFPDTTAISKSLEAKWHVGMATEWWVYYKYWRHCRPNIYFVRLFWPSWLLLWNGELCQPSWQIIEQCLLYGNVIRTGEEKSLSGFCYISI